MGIVKSFLTRDEMINIIQYNLTNDDDFSGYPTSLVDTTGYRPTSCKNCWKQIFTIKEIK